MTTNEPDAVTWQRLFASLIGDAAVDAATIREFCNIHGLTPDRVLSEMQARRQFVQLQELGRAQDGRCRRASAIAALAGVNDLL